MIDQYPIGPKCTRIHRETTIATAKTIHPDSGPRNMYIGVFLISRVLKQPLSTSKSTLRHSFSEYYQILFLERIINNYQASPILSLIFLNLNVMSTLCLFGVLGLHSSLDYGTLFLLVLIGIDCAILAQIMMYKHVGDVNGKSREVLDSWGKNQVILRDQYLLRVTRSFRAIRILIGTSGNYIEVTTALVIFDFTLGNVVSLLMAT